MSLALAPAASVSTFLKRDIISLPPIDRVDRCKQTHHHSCRPPPLSRPNPPLDVNTEHLCQLTSQLWDSRFLDTGRGRMMSLDLERHDVFLSYLGKCYEKGVVEGPAWRVAARGARVLRRKERRKEGEDEEGKVVNEKFKPVRQPLWKPKKRENTEGTVQSGEVDVQGQKMVVPKDIMTIPETPNPTDLSTRNRKLSKSRKSTADVQPPLQPTNSEELYKLLTKGQYERNPKDLRRMFQMLRHLTAFQNLSDFVLMQICGVSHFNEYESNRVVFRQGEEGTSWVERVGDGGPVGESVAVLELAEGNGFGELALVNDQRRAATILTMTPCKLLRVEKGDYLRILRFIHHSDVKDKVLFLKKVPVLHDVSEQSLSSMANVMSARHYEPSSFLIKQGDRMTEACFIKKGSCVVEATCMINGKEKNVKVGVLSVGDYFGEATVLQKNLAEDVLSPFSVRCIDEVPYSLFKATTLAPNLATSLSSQRYTKPHSTLKSFAKNGMSALT
ncbi:hypothetical protein BC829DRAFT_430613 [Chytridium lagenaria]|nr:hypothetical protein BC829DRAFT_430613 [Chytridium lagenaria]